MSETSMVQVLELIDSFRSDPEESTIDISSYDLDEFPADILQVDATSLNVLILDYNNIQILPDISLFTSLKELHIVGNELVDFTHDLSPLVNLQILNLNENSLRTLFTNIGGLKKLRVLSAIGNSLQFLPPSFVFLTYLEELYLDENNLTCLPSFFSNLKSLKKFEISNNKLESLPEDIGFLGKLTILNFNNNLLKSLPDSFSQLISLKFLDLSSNQLENLPATFSSAQTIEKLYLDNNNIKNTPQWFGHLENLIELTINDNGLHNEQFNDDFCHNSKRLRKLEAGANFMESLSEKFGNLENLEVLHFGSTMCELERRNFQNGNWMIKLPESFCNLHSLQKANLNENQIVKLPSDFGKLLSLSWLDLGQNMLRHLPSSFCSLINLEFLQLSKNHLKEVPENMGNLKKLTDLRLDHNLLEFVPDSIGDICNLKSLDLYHNNLQEIPSFIYRLNNLKRLDLDENRINLNLLDIPKITPGNKYPSRDPNLKDNWRGKSRSDQRCCENIVECNLSDEEMNDETRLKMLRLAFENRTSMRSSHVVLNPDEMASETLKASDGDFSVVHVIPPKLNKAKIAGEEDWDAEIEEARQYEDMMDIFASRKNTQPNVLSDFENALNKYPPAPQAYTACANYSSFVYKTQSAFDSKSRFVIIDGQFDDY